MAAKKDLLFTRELRDYIKKWDDDWRFNKDQYHEFTSFVMGSQWTEDESKLFIDYKKIPLSFNKLAPLINHLLGEQRMNTPNLQVVPSESVPVETAAIREALVKDISLNSSAKRVYQVAFQQAAIGGFGAYLIDTEYENNRSFEQKIVFQETKDPTWCYWDVSARSPCKTDGMRAGQRTRMSRKMFASIYGEKIERQIGSEANYDEGSATGWIFSNDREITVIDDYMREYKNVTIYQLSSGRVVDKKQLAMLTPWEVDGEKMYLDNGHVVQVVNDRDVPQYRITHRQCAGDFVLEEDDFPSEQLPVVFVDQNSYTDKSGKQICRPFIKDARDAQRYLNYLGTQSAYLMRVTRYDQYLVSKAHVKSPDTQQIWKDPATAQGGLIYDETPNGTAPTQLRPPELSASLITQYQRAMADIESCTGMYGTQIGDQGNEVSGKAIDARTKRGNYNTYVPFDSLNRAIAVGGEIINEMIPRVYDSERLMMLYMPDRGVQPVSINKPKDIYGTEIENDMRTGNYQIRLLPGPSFEGQKQENLESIQAVLQADPGIFRMVADLYVDNLPMANNIEFRNRLRTIIPPEIIEAGKTGKPVPPKQPEIPPEVQLKMQELQLMHMKIMQEGQFKMQELALKQQELQLKAVTTGQDIHGEMQKLEAAKIEMAAQLHEREMSYEAEIRRMHADMQITHANNLVKLITHNPKQHKETKA